MVKNELSSAIQDEILWCMLFDNNIVLVDKMRAKVMPNWSYRGKSWNLDVLDSNDLKKSIWNANPVNGRSETIILCARWVRDINKQLV